MNTNTKPKPTQKALAAALGISPQLVSFYARKPDAPSLSDISGWQEFISQDSRDGALPPDLRRAVGAARLKLLTAQSAREELKLSRERGEVCDRAAVERGISRIMTLIFDTLQRAFCFELPGAIVGKDEAALASAAKAVIDRLRVQIDADLASMKDEYGQH